MHVWFSLITAASFITSCERPSLEPQPYWGGENSGNALEASNAWIIGLGGSQPCSQGEFQEGRFSGKKKAHNIIFFCPVGLGTTPGLSWGFHRVCPWQNPGENLGQTRVFSSFYTVEARFHRVCPRDKPGLSWDNSGDEGRHRKLCEKVYVPFSLATLTLQPLLFWKKAWETPKKARVFLLAEPLKILGKERENAQKKQGKSENEKARKSKKQGLEGQGSFRGLSGILLPESPSRTGGMAQ